MRWLQKLVSRIHRTSICHSKMDKSSCNSICHRHSHSLAVTQATTAIAQATMLVAMVVAHGVRVEGLVEEQVISFFIVNVTNCMWPFTTHQGRKGKSQTCVSLLLYVIFNAISILLSQNIQFTSQKESFITKNSLVLYHDSYNQSRQL